MKITSCRWWLAAASAVAADACFNGGDDFLGSARERLFGFINGQTGATNPNAQGFIHLVKDGHASLDASVGNTALINAPRPGGDLLKCSVTSPTLEDPSYADVAIEAEMVPLRNTVSTPSVHRAFGPEGQPNDPRTNAAAKILLDDPAWLVKALQQARAGGTLPPAAFRLMAAKEGARK